MNGSPDSSQKYPFWSYQDLLLFLCMVLPCLAAAVLVIRGVAALVPGLFIGKAMLALPAQLLFYVFLFVCLFGLLNLRYHKPFWRSLAFVFPHPLAWMVIVAGPILAISVSLIGSVLRAPSIPLPFEDQLRTPAMIVLLGIFVIAIGPLCEELAFRGFLLPLLMRSLGAIPGILLTAIPFALLHGPQYLWSWQYVSLVFVAGSVFGWIRHRTGSTLASAVMHATYNLTFYVGFLVQSGRLGPS